MVHMVLSNFLQYQNYIWWHSSKCYNFSPLCRFISSSSSVLGKHYDPKFRTARRKKVCRVHLPDFDELRKEENLTVEEIRSKLKEKGIAPPREWTEKPVFINCSGAVMEPYVPPEGDGKIMFVSSPGMKQRYHFLQKKGQTLMALRKIRNFEYDFDAPSMAEKAQQIYIKAHDALNKKDEDTMHELVTEKCFPEIMENMSNKTACWKFIQSLEPPRVVHIRCQELMAKENTFAQATVRFHSQQTLAVYDRFGRLMHGSEDKVKDVLEYVVFEKHLSNTYGTWRIHAKIIPDWMPPGDSILKTFRKPSIKAKNHQSSLKETNENKREVDSEQNLSTVSA